MRLTVAIRSGFQLIFVCVALTGLTACTSAPIDMRAADPNEAQARVQQVELRASADELVALIEDNGWSRSDNPAEAARSLLGRLISGATDGAAEPSTVQAYLRAHAAPGEAALADMELISGKAAGVARLAIAVASADGRLPPAGLAQDIAASERALGAVRRAADFFEAVKAETNAPETGALDDALGRLEAAEAGLAGGADALAERRWATHTGLFG